MNEDVQKSLAKAMDRYVKQEEERKTCFFAENDSNSLSQVRLNVVSLLYIKQIDFMLPCVCSLIHVDCR